MCFSQTSSIIAFSIGLSAAIFAFCTRQYATGMLILAFSQMQLSEFFIWRSFRVKSSALNRFGTNYGKWTLALHNVALGVGVLIAVAATSGRNIKWTDWIPLVLGLGILLVATGFYSNKSISSITPAPVQPCASGTRLLWPYPVEWYIASSAVTFAIVLFWFKPPGWTIVALLVFTCVMAFIIEKKSAASLWCFASAVAAPIIVIVGYLIIRKLDAVIA
jgi:hypothetical protein